jgi:hypothetical protein
MKIIKIFSEKKRYTPGPKVKRIVDDKLAHEND